MKSEIVMLRQKDYFFTSEDVKCLLAYKKLFIEYNAEIFDNLQCLILASGILTEDQQLKITQNWVRPGTQLWFGHSISFQILL